MTSIPSTRAREPSWAERGEEDEASSMSPSASACHSLIESAMASQTVESATVAHDSSLERWNRAALLTAFSSAEGAWPEQPVGTGSNAVVEAYERLKANLWVRLPDSAMKVLLMISIAERTRGLTSAPKLAASLARDRVTKVLLLSFNSDAPRYEAYLPRIERARSFEEVLAEPAALKHADGTSNLCVLAAKCTPPLSIFRSEAMDRFFDRVREQFDYVVIDAPPLASHPETLLLAQKADAVVLEMESERTRKQDALWAKKQIETAGGKLAGVILTERRFRVPSWLYKRI